ncbi:hypothetical protein [Paenibacillus sp. FSL W7-1332]|uniref:hypothetical protein n=1 Tax=Paenibacillus sp. FSL W7-1332 TaxID=2921702 RepID=UPI0030CF4F37
MTRLLKEVTECSWLLVEAIQALIGSGVVDPDTRNQKGRSVHFRSKQLLLRQEACALLDKAF